jgi:NAD(P)-dependent dehydrogenase (short-subunit alcohol dehydrogenase family)
VRAAPLRCIDELLPSGHLESRRCRPRNQQGNRRNEDAAATIVASAIDCYGTIHGLVNNAMATREPKPFTDITGSDFALDYEVGDREDSACLYA